MRGRESLTHFISGMDLKHPVSKEDLERINALFRELNMRDHRTKKEKAMGAKLELAFDSKLMHIDYALAFKYQNTRSEMAKHCYLLFELTHIFNKNDLPYLLGVHRLVSSQRQVLTLMNGNGDFLILDPEMFEVYHANVELICEVLPASYELKFYQDRRLTITDIIAKNLGVDQEVCQLISFEKKVGGEQETAKKLSLLFRYKNNELTDFVSETGVELRLIHLILKGVMRAALKNVIENQQGKMADNLDAETQIGNAMVAAALFELLRLEDNECRAVYAGFEFVNMVACTGVKIRVAQMSERNRYGVTIGNRLHGFYVYDPSHPEVLVKHSDFQAVQYRLLPLADKFMRKVSVDLTVNDYLYYLRLLPLMLAEFVRIISDYPTVAQLFEYAEIDLLLRSQHFTDSSDNIYIDVMEFLSEFILKSYCDLKKRKADNERAQAEMRESAEIEVRALIAAGLDNQRLWIIVHLFDIRAYAAEQYFLRANAKFDSDTAGALKDCEISLMFAPTYQAYFLRATLKASLEELEPALLDCDKAIELKGATLKSVHILRMELCVKLKRDKEIVESATWLISDGERTDRVFSKRAASRLKLNDAAGALSDIEAALVLDNTNVSHYHLRGGIKYVLGDCAGALSDFQVDYNPSSLRSKLTIAACYLNLKQIPEARILLDEFLAIPNLEAEFKVDELVFAYHRRAEIAYAENNFALAAKYLDKVMSLKPNNIVGAELKANVQVKLNDLSGALVTCSNVIKLEPGRVAVRILLCEILIKMERFKEALSECDEGLEYNPETAILYNLRAEIKAHRGELTAARADYFISVSLTKNR